MTFVKEGKEMNYEEVMQLVVDITKRGILKQLDEKEIAAFIGQLLNWHVEKQRQYMTVTGYEIEDDKNLFNLAHQLHMIADKNVWEKGARLVKEADENGQCDKADLIAFVSEELLDEMKKNKVICMNKEELLNCEEAIE